MEHIKHLRIFILIFLSFDFKSALASVSCSFDQGWCGWKNEKDAAEFHWKVNSGQTDDRTSGPLNDHTCGNAMGQYIYISGNDVKTKNSVAVVRSAHILLATVSNLTFWYTMNGVGVGKLVLSRIEGNTTSELWKREGRQGLDWLPGFVQLQPGEIELEFSGTVRLPYGSDIALDDIQLASESQYFEKRHCKLTTTSISSTTSVLTTTTTPISTTLPQIPKECQTFDRTVMVLPGSCDFEKDLCHNKVSKYGKFIPITWERTNEFKNYGDLRIDGDHTKEQEKNSKGYYMNFDNGFPFGNDSIVAKIETPVISTNFVCLTFWFNMPSNNSNLRISIKQEKVTREIWKREETLKEPYLGWHDVSLTIQEQSPFSIIFETYNKKHMAYVGIDDILILGTNLSATVLPVRRSTTTNSVSSAASLSTTKPSKSSSSSILSSLTTPKTPILINSNKPVTPVGQQSSFQATEQTSSLFTTVPSVSHPHSMGLFLNVSQNNVFTSNITSTTSPETSTAPLTNSLKSTAASTPISILLLKTSPSSVPQPRSSSITNSTAIKTTTAFSIFNVTLINNTTHSPNTTTAGSVTVLTTASSESFSPQNNSATVTTKKLSNDSKGTKKLNIVVSTTERTKKPQGTTKRTDKPTDEERHTQDDSDNDEYGLSSVEIAGIIVAVLCLFFITIITAYFVLPKLKKILKNHGALHPPVSAYVYQCADDLTTVTHKDEQMNGWPKSVNGNACTLQQTVDLNKAEPDHVYLNTKL